MLIITAGPATKPYNSGLSHSPMVRRDGMGQAARKWHHRRCI
jgi:hypothetical protein